jgi:hypothetical protein
VADYREWESGLRLVEDSKPGGGVFGAYWREAKHGEIPPPPRRGVASRNGGRTGHEQAYLEQSLDKLLRSVEHEIAWSKALPIRNGGKS